MGGDDVLEVALAVVGVLLGLIGIAITLRLSQRDVLPVSFDAARLRAFAVWHMRDRVRISSSALVDIHEAGRWVLVALPEDRPGEFGPLGGAFKFDDSAKRCLGEMEFQAEPGLPSRAAYWRNDVRGFLPVRHLYEFLSWWRSESGRESGKECVIRELREELMAVGCSGPARSVGEIRLDRTRSVVEGPTWVVVGDGGYWQIRLFEVYLPRPEHAASSNFVAEVMSEAERVQGLVSVTGSDIRRGRIAEGTISGHSAYLLGRRRDRYEAAGRS